MDGATIQARIWLGYAKAAARIGTSFDLFRPQDPLNALGALGQQNRIGRITASFDASTYTYSKPNLYGKPVWYALLDGSLVCRGDYLADPCGCTIYFVAALQPLLPIACVECNRTFNVTRPAAQSGYGAQPYGGDVRPDETPIMTGYPGSMLIKSRGETGVTKLPGDVKTAWFEVLLPCVPGVTIAYDDVLTDQDGLRFKVGTVEITNLGWRLMALASQT